MCNVYGLEETALARMNLQEGETDAPPFIRKWNRGRGCGWYVGRFRHRRNRRTPGHGRSGGHHYRLQKWGTHPGPAYPSQGGHQWDDQEIGFTSNGPVEVGGDGLYLYLPTSVYTQIYDEPTVYKYSFNVAEDQQGGHDRLSGKLREQRGPLGGLCLCPVRPGGSPGHPDHHPPGGELLGIIFGVAGVLNLINTLVTTILIRRHEFATMQSIGA